MELNREEAVAVFVKEYGKEEWEWVENRMKNSPKWFRAEQYAIFMDMYPILNMDMLSAMFGKAKGTVKKRKESDKRACERDIRDTKDKVRIKELMDKRVPKYLMPKLLGISDYRVKKLCKEINPYYKPSYSFNNKSMFTEEQLEKRRKQNAEYYARNKNKLRRKRMLV